MITNLPPIRFKNKKLIVNELAKTNYLVAEEIQNKIISDKIYDLSLPDQLLFFEFDSIYTAGSSTKPEHIPNKEIKFIKVNRGGSITWHGPGQLVSYLPISLKPPKDIQNLVLKVEESIIETLDTFSIKAIRIKDRRGVWVKNSYHKYNKIAAIGMRTTNNIVSHGLSINCNNELFPYTKVIPCGIEDAGITTISKETGKDITVQEVYPVLANFMVKNLV